MFVIVCAAAARSKPKSGSHLEVSRELLDYKDVFSLEAASVLSALKQGDYIIEIKDKKEPPYGPLYNLS